MPIARERFELGMTYVAYKEQMLQNRERLEQIEQSVVLPETELHLFSQLSNPLHVVVLTEDWCESAIENIPVLTRLATASSKLRLRFFLRDQNLDIMDQYLKDGLYRSIPTFVFLDQDFRHLGYWSESPALIRALSSQVESKLYATDPAFAGMSVETPFGQLPRAAQTRLIQAAEAFRTQTRALSDAEVSREIRELLIRGLGTGERASGRCAAG